MFIRKIRELYYAIRKDGNIIGGGYKDFRECNRWIEMMSKYARYSDCSSAKFLVKP